MLKCCFWLVLFNLVPGKSAKDLKLEPLFFSSTDIVFKSIDVNVPEL